MIGGHVYGYCGAPAENTGIGLRAKNNWPDFQWSGVYAEETDAYLDKPFLRRPAAAELNRLLNKGDVVIFGRLDHCFRSPNDMRFVLAMWRKDFIKVDLVDAMSSLLMCCPINRWPTRKEILDKNKKRIIVKLFSESHRNYHFKS